MAIKRWLLYHIPFLSCLFFFSNPATCLQNNVTDRISLINFKQAIEKDPDRVLSSWNDSLHFCDWHGVTCSRRHPNRVIALNLKSQGLVGLLSPYIGNLSFLRNIDFENNSFHGEIPQEIGRLRRIEFIEMGNNSFQGNIPANLSNCKNLIFLGLNDNKLLGNIPDELGSLKKLQILGLSKNILTGTIPSSIGNVSSLRLISFRRNELRGPIPEEISLLRKLRVLILGENNLIGNIPRSIFNLSNLEVIEIERNRLNGTIPSDIFLTLPKLRSLALSYNRFTGNIPISFSNASVLEQVTFELNRFSGLIPKEFGKHMSRLKSLGFSNNQLEGDLSFIDSLTNCSNFRILSFGSNFLTGILPTSIANLSKELYFLSMSDNQLYNSVPLGIDNLINLRFLILGGNYLSGSVIIDFQKLTKLEVLSLQSNNFTGKIPSSISNCTKLTRLFMGYNNLNGKIPSSLGNDQNIILLDLSHNILTGSIPREILGLSSLSISLSLSGNALTGSIPSEIGMLQNLGKLDLSNNRLSGMIPDTIGKCVSLEELHLQGNLFDGEIPQVLGSLHGLRKLDISSNNFTGKISDSLVELDGLKFLNLSFNQIQGEVPKGGIFLNASAVSLLGNNGLCGGIAELKLPSCPLQNSRKDNSFAVKVIIPVVIAIFLAVLVSSLIFWRHKRNPKMKSNSIPPFQHQFLRISYGELFKATNGFSKMNIIGVGSYGSVYKGFLEQVGTEVAVKVINMERKGASKSFESECQALRTVRHRNLLKLLSVCSSIDFEGNDFKALIYEFMENGSLEKWLHYRNVEEDGEEIMELGNLKLIDRLNIAIDIATAIEYLHNGSSSTIIHGDLKPSNVLLDEEMTPHIGDFGLAKIITSISSEIQLCQSSSLAVKGTIGYVAPEYGMGDALSIGGDIYSYGIVLLEIFTGKKPTDEFFKEDINLHIFVKTSLPDRVIDIVDQRILFEEHAEKFKDCILSVLRVGVSCSMENPEERMKMEDVISELQNIRRFYLKQDQRNA